jgi:hypothetical protein
MSRMQWLCERYDAGLPVTCYLFDPKLGGNPMANARVVDKLGTRPITIAYLDRAEWESRPWRATA